MALDTKYRPFEYKDVLGQGGSVKVLRQFVKEGRGFHQSYVFSGQHGSGKTTLGRILARALLCSSPSEGEPCNECYSCKIFLEGGTHECFEELDAATKSGKSDLSKIIEDLNYSSFSGKRKIYLFDESHRLSKQALDALLKPMEDSVRGSEDKKLVCIFCTTEPEKMVSTIFSRCAPAFVIKAVSPEGIAQRLAEICLSEGIGYVFPALVTIAEAAECHIRDALKMLEGVSMLGEVFSDTVSQYLHLGANDYVLDILLNLSEDLPRCVETASVLSLEVSPTAAYERLAEASMVAYRCFLGVGKVPSQWDKEKISLIAKQGPTLLGFSGRFSTPPHRPSKHTLVLDVASLHYAGKVEIKPESYHNLVVNFSEPQPNMGVRPSEPDTRENPPIISNNVTNLKAETTSTGVWVDPRGISNGIRKTTESKKCFSGALDPETFRKLLQHHLSGMTLNGEGR